MKDEPGSNVGTHSQRMVPDASGSQVIQSASALKKVRFDDDDDDDADEIGKYRSRLQQHMAGLEQAYFSRRLNNTGKLYLFFYTAQSKAIMTAVLIKKIKSLCQSRLRTTSSSILVPVL